jgi:hypothetical protein
VPIATELANELLSYRNRCYPAAEGWLFASPATEKPYHQEKIQKKHIRPAAKAAGINCKVGWKTFRHSFRCWLDQTEAPNRSPARVDAARQHSNNDECVREGNDGQQEGSTQERPTNGPEDKTAGNRCGLSRGKPRATA